MKKVIKNNKKSRNKLIAMKEIYFVGFWARYGVRCYPFSGKYAKVKNDNVTKYIPLVYQYDDKNGTVNNFYLRRIDHTTSGKVLFWTFDKKFAESVAESLNTMSLFNNTMSLFDRFKDIYKTPDTLRDCLESLKDINDMPTEIDMDLFIDPSYKRGYSDAIENVKGKIR